jgi:altronate dehydratase small subunit
MLAEITPCRSNLSGTRIVVGLEAIGQVDLAGHEVDAAMADDDEQIWTALRLSKADNVATALRNLPEGAVPRLSDCDGPVLQVSVLRGHKFALVAIARGADVVKYGQPVGVALGDIAPGEHVHLHNIEGLAGRTERHRRRS